MIRMRRASTGHLHAMFEGIAHSYMDDDDLNKV